MLENDTKRILHVVSAMNRGGAETMIMNLYRKIDRNKLQFDFIVHSNIKGHYDDEIISLGGKIIRCNSLGTIGPIKYVRALSKAISENGPFHAIHAHTDFQSGFVAMAAKKAGINNRICHSHNTQWVANQTIYHKIQLFIFKEIIDKYATGYCSCGIDAAKFLFKKKKINSGEIKYLNNGIDVETFNLDTEKVSYLKEELKIDDDTLVIGHIGRFYKQKNHTFIIDIANKMKQEGLKFKVVLVGEGPLLSNIMEKVSKFGLTENVIFLGVREDIPQLMKIFDVFLFPSFFEGLPVVLVEAQAAGLKCIISDTITREIDFGLGLIQYCSLDKEVEVWTDKIKKTKSKENISMDIRKEKLRKLGYDAELNVKKIMTLYKV